MVSVFPQAFLWGASTASYQIEGAANEDGRGASIWDTFCATPGKVKNGDTGARACDHYHRYLEDIALMSQLGLKAYRFSIAWPRVLPTGRGAHNERGFAFYDRLIDALLKAGIEPWACLYHWDLPQALEDDGGWTNRDIANRFADYASLVGARYGDRVKHWATFNEPNVFTLFGYALGIHAPGRASRTDYLRAIHHVNLAHGRAVPALRAAMAGARIGIINAMQPIRSGRGGEDEGARALLDAYWNRAFTDPIIHGRYTEPLAAQLASLSGLVRDGDMGLIHQKPDYFGINHYAPTYVRADPGELGFHMGRAPEDVPTSGMGWEINPAAFRDQLLEIAERYGTIPIYVTENGWGGEETANASGRVDDKARTGYIAAYLGAVLEAREKGADVRGYFVWSLLDNFEWAQGYEKRFGIVRVDYETLKRTPKASFDWLKTVIARNAL